MYYRWPCVDSSGVNRQVRLSAIYFEGAPFTIPFSDTAVKRGGTWLYSPGSWHHAIDLSRGAETFHVKAAAPGEVIFIGWDWWSGNTIVMSHDSGSVKDAFRTIYMHLRNGPQHDSDESWNTTVPKLTEPRLSQYKAYLEATGCPHNGPRHPDANFWGTEAQKIDMSLLGKTVAAGTPLAWSGCTGPGGCGCTDDKATWKWGGGVNTHLHILLRASGSERQRVVLHRPLWDLRHAKLLPGESYRPHYHALRTLSHRLEGWQTAVSIAVPGGRPVQ